MSYEAIREIQDVCEKEKISFWKAVQTEDAREQGIGLEQSWKMMEYMWDSMVESLDSYESGCTSFGGLVGEEGKKMEDYRASQKTLCGDFMAQVMTNALKMGCNNACMKKIVAAPTAGACGVLPAVLITYFRNSDASREKMIESLYVAAGIGQVIAYRAYLAGASGGCQAEIGSAAAMAAGAVCYLKKGSAEQIGHACAMALKNLMGLVCDPVAGLVEVPCVKRNVGGAMIALSAADMALAGIESRIPVDQVMDAMKEVGDKMDSSLRETGIGGVAGTEKGVMIRQKLEAFSADFE